MDDDQIKALVEELNAPDFGPEAHAAKLANLSDEDWDKYTKHLALWIQDGRWPE